MKNRTEIEKKIREIEEGAIPDSEGVVGQTYIGALRWVLLPSDCSLCSHPDRADIELQVHRGDISDAALDAKRGWRKGTTRAHMDEHMEADPEQETHVEKARRESIDTLNTAETILGRLTGWIDEWEAQKDISGITEEWISSATRLTSEAHRGLRLIGQLKDEIGVDSQLMLAQNRFNTMMRALVDVLHEEPHYLNQIELRLASLTAPSHVQDAELEVID